MILADELDKGLVTKQYALERMANALPVKNLKKRVYEICKGHDIYFAWGDGIGDDGKPCIHALWATLEFEGMAQTLQFREGLKEEILRDSIIKYAEQMILKS